jgi:hypothetical protein
MAMDEKQKDTLDALEALLTSDGWQQLRAWVEREWGNDALAARIAAMNVGSPAELQLQLTEFLAARRAASLVLQWPSITIHDMKQRAEGPPLGRGASRMG